MKPYHTILEIEPGVGDEVYDELYSILQAAPNAVAIRDKCLAYLKEMAGTWTNLELQRFFSVPTPSSKISDMFPNGGTDLVTVSQGDIVFAYPADKEKIGFAPMYYLQREVE